MDKIATRIGLKREGRAKKLGIPKPLKAIRLKCLERNNGFLSTKKSNRKFY